MNQWNGTEWVSAAGGTSKDLTQTHTTLSSTLSQNLAGSLGYIRVPDNSGSGENVMQFQLTTAWASDGRKRIAVNG